MTTDVDIEPEAPETARQEREGPLFYVGAAGLLVAMAVDTVAVIGRHVGVPLLGSIEIVQAAILLAASAAMLTATLRGNHAVVHLLVDRVGPTARAALERVAALLSALLFLAFAIGSAWLASDLWRAHEESDLLHLPYKPLRLIVTLASVAIAAVFVLRAVRGERRR